MSKKIMTDDEGAAEILNRISNIWDNTFHGLKEVDDRPLCIEKGCKKIGKITEPLTEPLCEDHREDKLYDFFYPVCGHCENTRIDKVKEGWSIAEEYKKIIPAKREEDFFSDESDYSEELDELFCSACFEDDRAEPIAVIKNPREADQDEYPKYVIRILS